MCFLTQEFAVSHSFYLGFMTYNHRAYNSFALMNYVKLMTFKYTNLISLRGGYFKSDDNDKLSLSVLSQRFTLICLQLYTFSPIIFFFS